MRSLKRNDGERLSIVVYKQGHIKLMSTNADLAQFYFLP